MRHIVTLCSAFTCSLSPFPALASEWIPVPLWPNQWEKSLTTSTHIGTLRVEYGHGKKPLYIYEMRCGRTGRVVSYAWFAGEVAAEGRDCGRKLTLFTNTRELEKVGGPLPHELRAMLMRPSPREEARRNR